MPSYPVYSADGQRYCWIPDGPEIWAMNLDLTKPGKLVLGQAEQNAYAAVPGVDYTPAQLALDAPRRQARADGGRNNYYGAAANALFQPFGAIAVSYLLEAEYITALSLRDANQDPNQQGPLDTRVSTARAKLVLFWKRQRWNYDRFSIQQPAQTRYYRYSLENNFVGETAHIHGGHALYNTNEAQVRYRCTTPDMNTGTGRRFTAFMHDVPTFAGLESDAKTEINETLIAPRTVGDAPAVHQTIYHSFMADLGAARKQEIVQWVGNQFLPAHPQGAAVVRVGVWVRYVDAGAGHTADQNMSRDRFEKILTAAAAAGVHEVILLGDGWPAGQNWLDGPHCPYARQPGANQGRAHFAFLRMWEPDRGIPDLQHADPALVRGYAEQALTYSALYRNPAAGADINMSCIITNKSGGPDLPTLAGVPQIQFAEMAPNELFVHHRMGFQSLCSPLWSVQRVPQRGPGDAMTLTPPQVQELTTLIQRAARIRTWHLTALANDRYQW